jgi:diaminohydroxyphosphoribosylaminopyrimidine deaminase/5-amino-6-(5-phosphoribosylamino)uracil reductase
VRQGVAEALDPGLAARVLAELGEEAKRHRFSVAPNPCVGAAVLAGGQVVVRGFHEVWGGPHAEIVALDLAQRAGVPPARQDALIVTLEPCSSEGKTPPCVERLIASGVKRIVVGEVDPDPRHRGRGIEALRAAGIDVVLLEGVVPLARVAPHFLDWVDHDRLRRPRPWVIAKWAQTRSGQLVPPEEIGGGRWISGPESLGEVQLLRARCDALVTGVGTVLADDPRLTVRPPGDPTRTPWRIVLDSWLSTPRDARLLAAPGPDEGAGPVHVLCVAGTDATRHRELVEAGAEVHGLHETERRVSLRDALAWMWDQGLRRVMVESGPGLLGRFLDERFVDQVRVYTGPINGGRGPSMGEHLARLALEERLDRESGPDAVLEAFVRPEARKAARR